MQSTITPKGQITIPNAVRKQLHLRAGDRLELVVTPDGRVHVVPVIRSVTVLKGMVAPPPEQPLSLEDMNNAVAWGAARKGLVWIPMCWYATSSRMTGVRPRRRRG